MTALRLTRLRVLLGLSGPLAGVLAPLIYGEGRE